MERSKASSRQAGRSGCGRHFQDARPQEGGTLGPALRVMGRGPAYAAVVPGEGSSCLVSQRTPMSTPLLGPPSAGSHWRTVSLLLKPTWAACLGTEGTGRS